MDGDGRSDAYRVANGKAPNRNRERDPDAGADGHEPHPTEPGGPNGNAFGDAATDAHANAAAADGDQHQLGLSRQQPDAACHKYPVRLSVSMAEPPLVLMLVSDLYFAVQIEGGVKAMGYRLERVERGTDIEPDASGPIDNPGRQNAYLAEPLAGRSAGFVARLVEWQPALVLLELSSPSIPWPAWIAAMKASPATRRIPVVAFGPHTDLELRARAIDAGCDAVVAKSRLVTGLSDLITQYARPVDYEGLRADCQGEVSELARHGIELFNRQEYFEAHEELEHAWNEETGPVRELYRGILQAAVAYLQVTRRNYRGALKMFLRLRQWLDPLPDVCRGVNVAQLRREALAARAELEALGPGRMDEFDLSLLKPVQVAPPMPPQNGRADK